MIKFTKLLKIGLPVATLTAATIITATLLFSNREDLKLTNINEEALQNYEKELDPYKEELMKQADEPTADEEKNNQDSENDNKELNKQEQQAEEQIKEQLKNPDTKELIKELLTKPEELAKRLSFDDKLTQQQVKKIASRIQKLEEEKQGSEKVGVPNKEAEKGSLETQQENHVTEGVNNPSEQPLSTTPASELSEEAEDLGTREEEAQTGVLEPKDSEKTSLEEAEAKETGPNEPEGPNTEEIREQSASPTEEETISAEEGEEASRKKEKELQETSSEPEEQQGRDSGTSSDKEDEMEFKGDERSGISETEEDEPTLKGENEDTRELQDTSEKGIDSRQEEGDTKEQSEVDTAKSEGQEGSEDGHADGTGDSTIPLAKWQEIQNELLSALGSLGRKIGI